MEQKNKKDNSPVTINFQRTLSRAFLPLGIV